MTASRRPKKTTSETPVALPSCSAPNQDHQKKEARHRGGFRLNPATKRPLRLHFCIRRQKRSIFIKDQPLQHAMSKISVRFLFDKERKRVVFVEAGSDFIDVLFGFLTLPLGRIVRLLGKQTGWGSLDNIYESVDQLNVKYLQTEACKEMLLNPRSVAAELCTALKIKNIHDPNHNDFYLCSENDCLTQSTCYYTYAKKGRCSRCGKLMTLSWEWVYKISDEGGIFVNDTTNFMITDDLQVIPTSLMRGYSFLEKLQIKDASILEERVIDLGKEEVLNLLRRSFVSKNPLTDVCLTDVSMQASVNRPIKIKDEMDDNEVESEITLNLIINTKNNSVLCAEVGEDFVNQLLSFLTFPLGSVFNLLSDNASIMGGCIDNLYSSVKNLSIECFNSEDCRDMLLAPKLATFYKFEKQILNMEEITSKKLSVIGGCPKCYSENKYKQPLSPAPCKHEVKQSEIIEQNPKSGKLMTCSGGAFVVNSRRFMVADNLRISPLSFISAIKNYETEFPISDLVEKVVCIDKAKTLSLLSTMLISKTVLTDIFCPKAEQKKPIL